ncbi:MAG TPA: type I phosphomannose isomerase catalytic subunit [Chthoniobacterales bacterium]
MKESCLTFAPLYVPRMWGGRDLATLFQRKLPSAQLIGESWELVDRVDAQSVVEHGPWQGRTLHQLWEDHREEVFGTGLTGPRFPLLIKILDASDVLSVQVHPPVTAAATLGGECKTEVWYFVSVKPGASVFAGLKRGTTPETFQRALTDGMVASLMHRLESRPDEFIFIPSGRVHAIDAGNVLFEIQQNSDTTYRVFDWDRVDPNGNARQLHLRESLACIDFGDFEPELGRRQGELLVQCEYFKVQRWAVAGRRPAEPDGRFAVFQVVRGGVRVDDRTFRPGDLFLVPASATAATLQAVEGEALVLRTSLD